MTTPRPHYDSAARYFADDTMKCWAREKNSSRNWCLLRDHTFRSSDLEYYVGHEPPPPDKRTITLTVNGGVWVLPEPLRGSLCTTPRHVSPTQRGRLILGVGAAHLRRGAHWNKVCFMPPMPTTKHGLSSTSCAGAVEHEAAWLFRLQRDRVHHRLHDRRRRHRHWGRLSCTVALVVHQAADSRYYRIGANHE